MSNQSSTVDLGFAEECAPWKLESRLFPSKIGGKPAWLDLKNLPNSEDLQCNTCKGQMIFLCQIYAPYEEDDNNFHRTIFVFICRNAECCINNSNDNLRTFRSSLPRINQFYSADPPIESPDVTFSLNTGVKLCNLCGCIADKSCSRCKVGYCCRQHQVLDWKDGHKNYCGSSLRVPHLSSLLFKEFEIVIEPETDFPNNKDEKEAWEEYTKLKLEGNIGSMANTSESELEAHSSIEEDPIFAKFRSRIEKDPDQIIRYARGGDPLWIADQPTPQVIPNCDICKGPRQFEVQVMPQMLSVLHENELDWGTLVVYTCKSSCTSTEGYKKEFIFKQDVSSNKVVL